MLEEEIAASLWVTIIRNAQIDHQQQMNIQRQSTDSCCEDFFNWLISCNFMGNGRKLICFEFIKGREFLHENFKVYTNILDKYTNQFSTFYSQKCRIGK
jgi:hypothetical protein